MRRKLEKLNTLLTIEITLMLGKTKKTKQSLNFSKISEQEGKMMWDEQFGLEVSPLVALRVLPFRLLLRAFVDDPEPRR